MCVCSSGRACEAEFRSEVKCVNKSEEGGERVRVESVFSESLSECGGSREENTKSPGFSRAGAFSLLPPLS